MRMGNKLMRMEHKTVFEVNKMTAIAGPSRSKKSKIDLKNAGLVTEKGGKVSELTEQLRTVQENNHAEQFIDSLASHGSFEKMTAQETLSANIISANKMSSANKMLSTHKQSQEEMLSEEFVPQLLTYQDRSLRQRKSVNYKYSKTEHFVNKNLDSSSQVPKSSSFERSTDITSSEENSLDNNFKKRKGLVDVKDSTAECSSVHQSTIPSQEKVRLKNNELDFMKYHSFYSNQIYISTKFAVILL